MDRFRDFDAARAEREQEPLTFRLEGRDFTTPGTVPAGVLLDIGRAVAAGNQMAMFTATAEFFEHLVPDDQAEEFAAAVRTTDMETMLDLVSWIIEEATGRPLPSASSSASPSSTDTPPSRVVSLTPVESLSG